MRVDRWSGKAVWSVALCCSLYFSEFPSLSHSVLDTPFLRTEWIIPDGFLPELHTRPVILLTCKHDSFHKCTVLSPTASLPLCASLRALLQLSSLLVYHPILCYLAFYQIHFNLQTIFVRLSYCFSSFIDISSTILFTLTYRYH